MEFFTWQSEIGYVPLALCLSRAQCTVSDEYPLFRLECFPVRTATPHWEIVMQDNLPPLSFILNLLLSEASKVLSIVADLSASGWGEVQAQDRYIAALQFHFL